jgi:hypothetical protein
MNRWRLCALIAATIACATAGANEQRLPCGTPLWPRWGSAYVSRYLLWLAPPANLLRASGHRTGDAVSFCRDRHARGQAPDASGTARADPGG